MSDEAARLDLLWESIQAQEDYPLFRLTYLSKPNIPFTAEVLDDIESKSVEANNARDVTGLLIVNESRILQILEGKEESVRELYNKIEADERHTVVKLVCAVEDDVRLLMTWNMVVRGLNGVPGHLMDDFESLFDEFLNTDAECEISIDHVELFKTIALFGPLPLQPS